MSKKGSIIIFSSHRMEHVELFCKKLVILLKGKTVLKGYLKDIKEEYSNKNILVSGDIDVSKIKEQEGVIDICQSNDEYIIKVSDKKYTNDIFKIISKYKNITKFVVEEPSLNEIFISKVGENYEK